MRMIWCVKCANVLVLLLLLFGSVHVGWRNTSFFRTLLTLMLLHSRRWHNTHTHTHRERERSIHTRAKLHPSTRIRVHASTTPISSYTHILFAIKQICILIRFILAHTHTTLSLSHMRIQTGIYWWHLFVDHLWQQQQQNNKRFYLI